MTASAGSLVGRDREIELLHNLLDEAGGAGEPRFVQITGEPGIGKTYLLDALGREADSRGWLVLRGRSSELESELPFGLVIDAFDAYLGSLDPQTFDRLAPDSLTELAGLFPSLRSLSPAPEYPTTPSERFRTHKAVVHLIERLCARQPVLLLLDDLHWADPASVEQADYVLRRPPHCALMIVGSFRTGQADPALATAVEVASREGRVTHIELGPLSAKEAEALVGADAGGQLYEQSGGNPFYLLQLARVDGAAPAAPAAAVGVPAAVAETIARELETLTESGRRLAQAAAVAGDPFELDLAAATAAIPDADALAALDELTARDLVRPTEVPRNFQFRHPLVRSAIYQACPPGTRLAAHERSAEIMASRGAPATARAHHVEQAARHGDLEAIAVLREAGEAATGRAPASAARWYSTALRLMPADAEAQERVALLLSLAGALGAIGRFEEAHGALLEGLQLATDDGPVPRVRLISACAAIENLLGRREDAHRRLTAALAAVEGKETPDAASLMIDLATDAFLGMDYEGMQEWAAKAVEAARPLGDPALLAAALSIHAFACANTIDIEAAQRSRAEALELFHSLTDEDLARRLDMVGNLTGAHFYLDAFAEGERIAVRGLDIAKATGQGDFFPVLIQALGNLYFTTGRYRQAADLLDEAIDSARTAGNVQGLWWTLLNRCYSALQEGDLETAWRCGEEGFEFGQGLDDAVVALWASGVLGMVAIEDGDFARGERLLLELSGGEEMNKIPGGWRCDFHASLVEARIGLGDHEGAARVAAICRKRADECGLELPLAMAERAEALVALDSGEAAKAAELALSAADRAASVGASHETGADRVLAGRALAEAGDTSAAIEQLRIAAAGFEATGATRYRDQAEHELRALGEAVHRRTERGVAEHGVGALTGRELEIARLVVDRKTNPEIAKELFLSIKTVETHMRNIFRKLDVSSRVEVARVIERETE